ncbi:MAG: RNA polymerase sigma-70 factor [Flavisolibacter sp.]
MSLNPTQNNLEGSSSGDLQFDAAAFEDFFKKHYPPLCLYCKFKYGFDIDLAEDIVNASFARLWELRKTLASKISPRSYLYKIVDNSSLNALKHQTVKQKHAEYLSKITSEEKPQISFDSIEIKELRSAINAAISELPEQMRLIFELSRFEGLKYTEIANRLDISIKTVETQMSRALVKLREKLSGFISCFIMILIFGLLLNK